MRRTGRPQFRCHRDRLRFKATF